MMAMCRGGVGTVWTYVVGMLAGFGALMGWIVLSERIDRRHFERYRRELTERRQAERDRARRN
jgi:hypothetical protein